MNVAPERCSRLSYDLAWGTFSLRTVVRRTEARRTEVFTGADATQWELMPLCGTIKKMAGLIFALEQ